MANRVIAGLLCLVLAVCVTSASAQDEPAAGAAGESSGRIAFIQNGEVCTANSDGSDIKAITQSEGRINDFQVSPFLDILVVTREYGLREEVGYYEDDEEVPKVPIYSIVFFDLNSGEELAEIEPGDWLELRHWTTGRRFMYYSSSGYDISGFFEYDVSIRSLKSLDYRDGNALMSASFSDDRSLLSYTDNVGLGKDFRYRLHVTDRRTGNDKIVASKPKIFNPCFSPDNKYLAFIEVQIVDSQSVDVVWICDLDNDSMKETYSAPALAKSDSWMSWSPGGGHIGLFWSGAAYLFAVENPSDVHMVRGGNFCWLDEANLLFERGGSVYVYNLMERKDRLLIENASKPTALRALN